MANQPDGPFATVLWARRPPLVVTAAAAVVAVFNALCWQECACTTDQTHLHDYSICGNYSKFATEGYIVSPEVVLDENENINCTLEIRGEPSDVLTIHFEQFAIEGPELDERSGDMLSGSGSDVTVCGGLWELGVNSVPPCCLGAMLRIAELNPSPRSRLRQASSRSFRTKYTLQQPQQQSHHRVLSAPGSRQHAATTGLAGGGLHSDGSQTLTFDTSSERQRPAKTYFGDTQRQSFGQGTVTGERRVQQNFYCGQGARLPQPFLSSGNGISLQFVSLGSLLSRSMRRHHRTSRLGGSRSHDGGGSAGEAGVKMGPVEAASTSIGVVSDTTVGGNGVLRPSSTTSTARQTVVVSSRSGAGGGDGQAAAVMSLKRSFRLRYRVSKRALNGRSCALNEFRCPSDHKCIPVDWRCNRNRECEDGSDERDCFLSHSPPAPPHASSAIGFRPSAGSTINERSLGVGRTRSSVSHNKFAAHGRRTSTSDVTSFELMRNADGQSRPFSVLRLTNSEDSPIAHQSVNDTHSSHSNCLGRDYFPCGLHTTECYTRNQHCDGNFDCSNGLDEQQCEVTRFDADIPSILVPPPAYRLCKLLGGNATRCSPSSSFCYLVDIHRCNGVMECPRGEDEHGCDARCRDLVPCAMAKDSRKTAEQAASRITFSSHRLLGITVAEISGREEVCGFRLDQRCDGRDDCANGIDESNCLPTACGGATDDPTAIGSIVGGEIGGGFLCNDGHCIGEERRCDRVSDCADGEDELYCVRNSVITAAIMGSLVCGILVVIAISCTCRLYALRLIAYQRQHNCPPGGGASNSVLAAAVGAGGTGSLLAASRSRHDSIFANAALSSASSSSASSSSTSSRTATATDDAASSARRHHHHHSQQSSRRRRGGSFSTLMTTTDSADLLRFDALQDLYCYYGFRDPPPPYSVAVAGDPPVSSNALSTSLQPVALLSQSPPAVQLSSAAGSSRSVNGSTSASIAVGSAAGFAGFIEPPPPHGSRRRRSRAQHYHASVGSNSNGSGSGATHAQRRSCAVVSTPANTNIVSTDAAAGRSCQDGRADVTLLSEAAQTECVAGDACAKAASSQSLGAAQLTPSSHSLSLMATSSTVDTAAAAAVSADSTCVLGGASNSHDESASAALIADSIPQSRLSEASNCARLPVVNGANSSISSPRAEVSDPTTSRIDRQHADNVPDVNIGADSFLSTQSTQPLPRIFNGEFSQPTEPQENEVGGNVRHLCGQLSALSKERSLPVALGPADYMSEASSPSYIAAEGTVNNLGRSRTDVAAACIAGKDITGFQPVEVHLSSLLPGQPPSTLLEATPAALDCLQSTSKNETLDNADDIREQHARESNQRNAREHLNAAETRISHISSKMSSGVASTEIEFSVLPSSSLLNPGNCEETAEGTGPDSPLRNH